MTSCITDRSVTFTNVWFRRYFALWFRQYFALWFRQYFALWYAIFIQPPVCISHSTTSYIAIYTKYMHALRRRYLQSLQLVSSLSPLISANLQLNTFELMTSIHWNFQLNRIIITLIHLVASHDNTRAEYQQP